LTVADALGVTLGLRYTNERKHGIYTGTTSAPGVPPILASFQSDVGKSWTSFDPRITLDYHFTPDIMAYATFSRGFKSGGFQFVVIDQSLSDRVFDPERVSAYEAGLRTELFDRKVKLNLTGFHYDYGNLQLLRLLATSGGASTVVDNVASSRIDGMEAEAQWKVTPGFTLGGSYAYLDARFKEYTYSSGQDFGGTPLPRSPWHSVSAFADIAFDLPGGIDGRFHADWSYTSSLTHEPGGFGVRGSTASLNPAFVERGHNIVNLRAELSKNDWTVTAYVDNLFDEAVRAGVQDFPSIPTPFGDVGNQTANYWARPRSYGVSLRYVF
jgi:iron complex outermembrane receptor protein